MEGVFNFSKAINAVLYIIKHIKRADFHKIFKILYFSDRDMLAQTGMMITGDTYIAMNDGPVPSNIYDIFKSVRGDGFFKNMSDLSSFIGVENWDIVVAKKDPDMGQFSKMDIKIIDNAIQKYGNLSWDEIREKSHDYAWRSTTLNRPMSVKDMLIESGSDDGFIQYVKEEMELERLVR
ncbi:MAG: SocA family protein [Bacteroidales bacterium]|nr:SocA family protein [Bacteroidales bacterium]MBQ7489499.1 SocA family protein [Bacteroidales bacterium]